jgi:hypothetical protein
MDSVSSLNDTNDVAESISMAKKEPLFLQHVINTIYLQFKGVTQDFQKNGMPWEGPECCSLMAGCSGILYALPALVCPNQVERAVWILQACLSVLADYFHIHHDSIWHGIDRYFAIFNSIFIVYRACDRLNWPVILLAIPPVGCYVTANRAKNQLDLSAWHWFHFGWHITGGVLATLVIHLLYSCPDTDSLLMALCQAERSIGVCASILPVL